MNISMELLGLFILLNIVNVIVQTVKSLCTIKCGKVGASIVNGIAYGWYTIVTIYMLCDLPLMWKAGIVALCNLVGVFVVKWIEEKARKDKLWKVEIAVAKCYQQDVERNLCNIPHNYIDTGSWIMFNCYCNCQSETAFVVDVAKRYKGKISAYESKSLI